MARKNPEMAQKIRDACNTWDNYWKDNKNNYNEYNQFIFGNQWLDEEARVFETYKKIPLTMNKIAPLANHLLGEQRQNTPTLQVQPTEDTNEQTAEVRESLVKDICLNSETDVVFQTAFQSSLCGGYGAFYIDTEYENAYSFNQVIKFRKIEIPTRCYWDVGAMSPAKTDGMHAGFRTRMSRAKAKALYGKKVEESIPPSNIEEGSVFNDDESITIYTHWERKYERVTLIKLSNGRTVTQAEFDDLETILMEDMTLVLDDGLPVTIEAKRSSPRYKVKKYVYAGDYELEAEDFPSEQLPMIFVDQNSFYNKEGSQICRSFFKDTKDAQRYINYLATQAAYLIKIGRYDQFLVAAGNARSNDTAQVWRDPTNIQGGLKFDEVTSGFVPQQLKPPELSMSLIQQYERAERDIQTCTGMYNTMTGDQGNETSKLAIDARTKRGNYNTHTPFANLNRAIATAGEIVNEMIPKVYDTERTLMVNMKETGMSPVNINKPMDAYGAQMENDMVEGRYQIRLMPGPSFEGQKQEALNSMQLILQANPQLFNLIADLYVENLPLANNLQLRNRLKTIVPPEIIEAGKTGQPVPPKPQPPDPMIEIKMKELALKEQQLKMEQEKLGIEAHAKGQDVQMKWQELEAKRQEAAAQLQEMELKYMAEMQRTQTDEQIAHANNLVRLLTHANKQPTGVK
jgi:uncharacterized Zn finger protein